MSLQLDNDLRRLLETIRELSADTPVYLVGGAVRDLLLNRPAKDLDFVQAQGSIQLARAASRRLHGSVYTLDDARQSARVILRQGEEDEQILDFTSFIGETLQEDLHQRDFTVNAIAVELAQPTVLIDPLGGEADLKARQLRLCGPDSLNTDPIRVLRGVRLISSYDLCYGAGITAAMRVAIKRLGAVSGERIRDELFKCLAVANLDVALELSANFGVLDQFRVLIFGVDPVLPYSQKPDHWQAEPQSGTIANLNAPAEYSALLQDSLQGGRKRRHLLQLCSILLHLHPTFDTENLTGAGLIPDLFSEQIFQALLIGFKEKNYFKAVSGGFLRLAELSRQEPGKLDYYRFFREFGGYGLDSALLAMRETTANTPLLRFSPQICEEVFRIWFNENSQTVNPRRLVDGNLLQRDLGIVPGAKIGELLEEIREQQVLGRINSTEDALAFARESVQRKV